ncbi:hypothetical protein HHI36_009593 [Cryptolaemus montrouzieri]|uniref:Ig-like domain-containing protein n=1 Tax=Cryptolaemus montrouzieri TaxID=559131 RepID=A0ABD2MG88_9CUCU
MENDISMNLKQITPDHDLMILNFTSNDTGVYFCIGLEEQDTVEKINYLVDLVEKANDSYSESGNITEWLKYHEDNMFPLNNLFKNSLSPEYVYIREKLHLNLEMKTDWDVWSPCEICGREIGKGIRKRKGRCRLKVERNEMSKIDELSPDEIFLVNAFEISCRSLLLERLTPTIFNSTKIVADFIEIQHCEGVCNPDSEGVNAGWKVGKAKSYKYRKTVVLSEGDHLILTCPETSLERKKVVWKKNGKELRGGGAVKAEKPNEEPRIFVDTFGTLQLVGVKSSEEGNYTCTVDDIKMQQVIVFVTKESKLLTKLFLRHLLYLGFVISLTLTCYIGGLIIVCTRRYTFKTYKMLKDESKGSSSEDSGDEDF